MCSPLLACGTVLTCVLFYYIFVVMQYNVIDVYKGLVEGVDCYF